MKKNRARNEDLKHFDLQINQCIHAYNTSYQGSVASSHNPDALGRGLRTHGGVKSGGLIPDY